MPEIGHNNRVEIRYEFEFSSGEKIEFPLVLSEDHVALEPLAQKPPPTWTALEFQKCEGCPLEVNQSPQCPVAFNLSGLVESFKDKVSHENVKIRVFTSERDYFKEAPLQEGLFSIFGIIMATSGCPRMNFLKPMARYHLPFQSMDESIVRSVSLYLLSQYFVAREGGEPDMDLKKLDEKYEEVQKVNRGITARIKTLIKRGDANQNTVTTLDCIAKLLSMAIKKDLQKYASIFKH